MGRIQVASWARFNVFRVEPYYLGEELSNFYILPGYSQRFVQNGSGRWESNPRPKAGEVGARGGDTSRQHDSIAFQPCVAKSREM
jgi:hypothetical protein